MPVAVKHFKDGTIFDNGIKGNILPMGVSETIKGVQFSFYGKRARQVRLLFYLKGEEEPERVVDLEPFREGELYSVCFLGTKLRQFRGYEYMYEVDGKEQIDPYANAVTGRELWDSAVSGREGVVSRGAFYLNRFAWEGDRYPETEYSDTIMYQLHVRGFTRHRASGVRHKGTFAGIIEKIPYLKELGITALLLLPCYDFDENFQEEEKEKGKHYVYDPRKGIPMKVPESGESRLPEEYQRQVETDKAKEQTKTRRVNYWGYTKSAHYFLPKPSFAGNGKNSQDEMKTMIKALHREGIEVLMDFYFDPDGEKSLMLDCLRFWRLEYHIDGFRVNENAALAALFAGDPVLGGCKMLALSWNLQEIYGRNQRPEKTRMAEFNEGFLTDARRLLKSDEGMVGAFSWRFRRIPEAVGLVNYITSVNGFTLADLVSYDVKHNEANGEDGKDGTDYNFSWNCGVEGPTRKPSIVKLRKQQMRNALLLLFLSQGAPMLLAGDEFGNSQEGNNNAYCQDNPVGWVNWSRQKSSGSQLAFVRELIAFRKRHPVFHRAEDFKGSDYRSTGMPDLSFHGAQAWYMDASNYSRLFGVMLNGRYVRTEPQKTDSIFYVAVNMHWESHEFYLPKLPKELVWAVCVDSSLPGQEIWQLEELEEGQKAAVKPLETYRAAARSIVLFCGVKGKKKPRASKKAAVKKTGGNQAEAKSIGIKPAEGKTPGSRTKTKSEEQQ